MASKRVFRPCLGNGRSKQNFAARFLLELSEDVGDEAATSSLLRLLPSPVQVAGAVLLLRRRGHRADRAELHARRVRRLCEQDALVPPPSREGAELRIEYDFIHFRISNLCRTFVGRYIILMAQLRPRPPSEASCVPSVTKRRRSSGALPRTDASAARGIGCVLTVHFEFRPFRIHPFASSDRQAAPPAPSPRKEFVPD